MMKYFTYSADNGFSVFKTAEEAEALAENLLQEYREDSYEDGWSEDVESVCWGEILQYAKMIRCGIHPDHPCEYVLSNKQQQEQQQ